jgi:hypothetical protein
MTGAIGSLAATRAGAPVVCQVSRVRWRIRRGGTALRRPAVAVLVLLLALFAALPAGLLLYAATRPCPEMWLLPGPGLRVACPWWDITCHRCH